MSANFCSYNLRGLNNKVAYAKDFLSLHNFSIVALLETHVKKELAESISSFVGPRYTWRFNYDHHHNGRLWLGWDESLWKIIILSSSAQQLSCRVTCIASQSYFFLTIVYGANTAFERRSLWSDLSSFQHITEEDGLEKPWCIMGDFNTYLDPAESEGGRVGGGSLSRPWSSSMLEFKECVTNLGLTDLRSTGQFLTWWDSNTAMPLFRKLDRIMVNGGWLDSYSQSMANFLTRGLSDHCPAVLNLGVPMERVKKPFQFFHHLLDDPDFLSVVTAAWNVQVSGDPWYILTSKLKKVKEAMISLNTRRGNVQQTVRLANSILISHQRNMPVVPSSSDLVEEIRLKSILFKALETESKLFKQKSKVHWLQHGDNNNKYFFKSCKGRWNCNKILSLEDDNGTIHTSMQGMSDTAVHYFHNLLGTSRPSAPIPNDLDLPCLTDSQSARLLNPISDAEILDSFKSMAKNRSPGPDGFTPEFFIAAWCVVGQEVVDAVKYFFQYNSMPRIVNATAVALIPKHSGASKMSQFRPIACCNVLYKCVSKIIAARLKPCMNDLISMNQTAFVPHRSMGDNILLAQSLCHNYHLNRGQPKCTVKLDISKAFDNLNWDFLLAALHRMNFPAKFIQWIHTCLAGMISIKLNGSLQGFFQASSGVRQGDPISPYLFVLAMEVFSACITTVSRAQGFSFHWGCKDLNISHITFADDVLLFCKGDTNSLSALLKGVQDFSIMSGLYPNPAKCSIFFGNVPSAVKSQMVHVSGFQEGHLPVTYLGLPLVTSQLNTHQCTPLLQKLCSKIQHWSCKYLSFAGRLQLIRSVLFAIQGYWSVTIFLPLSTLKKIQSIMARFLWSGTNDSLKCHYKVSWKECCLPIAEGGLGIKCIFDWNKAAMLHHLWKLLHRSKSLWGNWFHQCFLKNKAIWTVKTPTNCPWSIRKILAVRSLALNHISYTPGQNSEFLMWHDPWSTPPLICQLGDSIIPLTCSSNLAKAGSCMRDTSWYVGNSNHHLVIVLRQHLQSIPINLRDKIMWNNSSSIKISTIWETIRDKGNPPAWADIVWHPWCIKKCSFILWLAFKNRLLTKDRMLRFGINTDPICTLCGTDNESVVHLFEGCCFTNQILNCSPFPLAGGWSFYREGRIAASRLDSTKQRMCSLFLATVVYVIWRERNNRIHRSKPARNVASLIDEIKNIIRSKLFTCNAFHSAVQRDMTLAAALY